MQMSNMSGVDVRGFGNKLFICSHHNFHDENVSEIFAVNLFSFSVSNLGLDYDLQLQSVNILKNSGGLRVQQMRRRLILDESVVNYNFPYDGISIDQTYGHILLQKTDISHNNAIGLRVQLAYGRMYLDECNLSNNTGYGIDVRFRTRQSSHVFTFSVQSTSLNGTGTVALNIQPYNCGYYRWISRWFQIPSTITHEKD